MIYPKILRLLQFIRNVYFGVGGLRDWLSYIVRRSLYAVRNAARPTAVQSMEPESSEVEEIFLAMEHSGYFVPSAPMPTINSIVSKMVGIANDLIKQSQHKMSDVADSTKTYWVDLNNAVCLSKHAEFVGLINSPALVNAARQYLGDAPVISSVMLVQTIGSADNIRSPKASQMWHVDNDDTRMFKFFVYLTDVHSTTDGPFSLVPAPLSKKVAHQLLFKLKLRARIPDEVFFESLGSKDRVVEMLGASGSWFVADTHRCYHFGSRSASNRIALFVTYISPVSLIQPSMNLAN